MQLTLFVYTVIVVKYFLYKPLDTGSVMVKVTSVLNLDVSNCAVPIFTEDLVSVIRIESTFHTRSKMNSAINHVAIDQFSLEFGSRSSSEFPCHVASVDLSSY